MQISAEFPFESKFAEVKGSKIHYIEQGEGQVFLFLHGNPTWSYLWRNVIPPVARHGRCVAFDLIGFGKSDKPNSGYTFLEHYEYVEEFIDTLGLKDIILVGHDWGGVLGFYYALNHRDNVRGIAFMETFPFTFNWDYFPGGFRTGFKLFRTPLIGQFLIMVLNMFVNKLLPSAVYGELSKEIHQNYRRPFPTIKSRYPVYVWPNELPIEGRESKTFKAIKRIEESLSEFDFPMLLITCKPGGVLRKEKIDWLRSKIRNLTIKDIGHGIHFIQEDNPVGIAQAIIEWGKNNEFM
jgi:pimeloyl-ACP methyl ester carboxylesterase